MQIKSIFKVEQDYRIFFAFMTLVLIGAYVLSFIQNAALHQFWYASLFTGLMAVHILLHWSVISIVETSKYRALYVFGQGLLAFIITYLSHTTGMIFALFMALIGETIGFLGINRRGILATLYYLALSSINLALLTNFSSALRSLITVIPVVIFVGMYVTLYLRQAEAREKAQQLAAELEATNRQLADYVGQVEDLSIANERQRMARELHDTLSQGLAGLILQLEAADAHLSHNRNDKARDIIANAMEQARSTLTDARRAIDDLRQPSLDDLDSALRSEISRFTNATGIPVQYQSDQTPPQSDPVKETLIRSVAEAFTNIAHHAKAQTVEVNVRVNDKRISVTIQDDGQGFDTSTIPSGHYGILGIKERVRLVNGNLEIQSEPGKGTTLKIEVPLSLPATAKVSA